jgi:hypothetical protein
VATSYTWTIPFPPELFDDFVKTHLLLWYCQAEQERHATRPKTEDNKTEKGRHSR